MQDRAQQGRMGSYSLCCRAAGPCLGGSRRRGSGGSRWRATKKVPNRGPNCRRDTREKPRIGGADAHQHADNKSKTLHFSVKV